MRLHVQDNLIIDYVSIYLIDESNDRRTSVTMAGDGDLNLQTQEPGTEMPVFFKMPRNMFQGFVREILKYADENHIEGEKESALEARLEVTQHFLDEAVTNFNKAFNHILKKKL